MPSSQDGDDETLAINPGFFNNINNQNERGVRRFVKELQYELNKFEKLYNNAKVSSEVQATRQAEGVRVTVRRLFTDLAQFVVAHPALETDRVKLLLDEGLVNSVPGVLRACPVIVSDEEYEASVDEGVEESDEENESVEGTVILPPVPAVPQATPPVDLRTPRHDFAERHVERRVEHWVATSPTVCTSPRSTSGVSARLEPSSVSVRSSRREGTSVTKSSRSSKETIRQRLVLDLERVDEEQLAIEKEREKDRIEKEIRREEEKLKEEALEAKMKAKLREMEERKKEVDYEFRLKAIERNKKAVREMYNRISGGRSKGEQTKASRRSHQSPRRHRRKGSNENNPAADRRDVEPPPRTTETKSILPTVRGGREREERSFEEEIVQEALRNFREKSRESNEPPQAASSLCSSTPPPSPPLKLKLLREKPVLIPSAKEVAEEEVVEEKVAVEDAAGEVAAEEVAMEELADKKIATERVAAKVAEEEVADEKPAAEAAAEKVAVEKVTDVEVSAKEVTAEEGTDEKAAAVEFSAEEVAAEEDAKEVAEKVSEEVTEIVAEIVTEKVVEEVAEKAAKKVAEDVAEKVVEKVAEIVTEKVAERVSEKVAEKAAEKVAENVAVEVAEEALGEAAGEAAGEVTKEAVKGENVEESSTCDQVDIAESEVEKPSLFSTSLVVNEHGEEVCIELPHIMNGAGLNLSLFIIWSSFLALLSSEPSSTIQFFSLLFEPKFKLSNAKAVLDVLSDHELLNLSSTKVVRVKSVGEPPPLAFNF